MRLAEHGEADVAAVSLRCELALVESRDTASVMSQHDVWIRLLFHHLDLAQRGKGPSEVPLHQDVPKAEAAAVEPGRVVAYLGTECLDEGGHHGRALAAVDVGLVDSVPRDDLVVMASRVHGHDDSRNVANLLCGYLVAQSVKPLRVVHDLFRQHERLAQFGHDGPYLRSELRMANELLPHLFVVTI